MAIPDFQSLMLPFLETLQDGKERTMREITELLAARSKLTEEERQEHLPSGPQSLFYNRVAWAKTHLKNAGLIDNPHGRASISEAGRKVLLQKPPSINSRFLKQFPSYQKFRGQVPGPDGEDKDEPILESTKTPMELLESSFNTLLKATAKELLDRLKACSPGLFEQVVVKLLRAMGYGGFAGEAKVTGKPGDAGIDGIIKQDKLGLDVVCIQAKRWGDNSVGGPVIHQFAGSMGYVGASKGVIITTSQFTDQR
jgi:restriction system protein